MPTLNIPRVPVGLGGRSADVELVYETHGSLHDDGANCILLPTYYTGTHDSYRPWIGPGLPFDPDRWFVVVPNLIGNGLSRIRDSETGRAWDPVADPPVRVVDNVAVQRILLGHLGIRKLALVAGWSMGGLQAYQWAVSYPDLVEAFLPICASAQCWPLNFVFLEGLVPHLIRALRRPADASSALADFGRAYAAWAFSAAYYGDELWRADSFHGLDDILDRWAEDHIAWNPADLLTMLRTWQSANPRQPGLTIQDSLAAITARAVVMPCTTDMYFTLAENEKEVSWMPRAELRPISSAYGHIAGRPGHLPKVTVHIRQAAHDLLTP
ncbi:homoserine O-acetyltransferase [Mycobacterium saskatchewanense]|uniref:Homoserine O-acetyltransferase n=1 Tax=Mycobacterium saskatchewanense TaxID=220927 RepID=A0A1X2BY25_9MYCO|nr:alpha/beta fold hydrolase [Mycobacterium saskatchewanense]ORW68530.1 hypothetical protein AWC23_20920 [Mycobacterium saskatchewanense]BBX64212.1 homoserine O-acetyltransferase [Mycobacterium saskatchewanense]